MRNFFIVIIPIILAGCEMNDSSKHSSNTVNIDSLKQVLMKADQDFSDLSKAKGRNTAFLEYMDEHVSMLRANGMPLVGKDTMRKRFAERPDTSYTLTWQPLYADAAKSGELGYTYGRWLLITTTNDTSEGTYTTIWKKDANGNWKFVLDTGNEGLKPK